MGHVHKLAVLGALALGVSALLPSVAARASTLPGWTQQAELTPSDAAPNDEAGYAVAVSGNTAVVGSPNHTSSTLAGAVTVFVRSGTTWKQKVELTPSDTTNGQTFGTSVAIAGSTLVVGAPTSNGGPGSAYVFTVANGVWSQQAKLTAADGADGDQFGISVAVSGSTVLVGANTRQMNYGAAYVFTRSGTVWSQQAELLPRNLARGDQFGSSVALYRNTALIGSPYKNGRGAAYVFTGKAATWHQHAELTASDGATNDHFGTSLTLAGTTAVIGAPYHNSYAGSAYVFTSTNSVWSQQAELTASDEASSDNFGQSVSLSGASVAVGAYGHNSFTGDAYVFSGSVASWSQTGEVVPADGAPNDSFGWSVALSGSTLVAGAPQHANHTGAAYVFVSSGSPA